MPFYPVENIGRFGVVKDFAPEDLPRDAWSDARNIRFLEGRAEKSGGWIERYSFGNPGASPLWFFPWRVAGGAQWWVYATADRIYRMDPATHQDITREDNNNNKVLYNAQKGDTFSGGVFNGVPIVNNSSFSDPPQQWDDSNSIMKDLSNWPSNFYCKIIRPFQNFLIAANVKDGGVHFPYTIRWSAIADPGKVPPSWDITDPTVLAGENYLSETDGVIQDMRSLGDDMMVYKTDSIVRMRFVGGQFVFSFDTMVDMKGLLAPNAVREFPRGHILVSNNDIAVNDGSRLEPISRGKNQRWFFSSLNQDYSDRTFIVPDVSNNEAWICFVSEEEDPNATEPNLALVWNWEYNTWTVREIPYTMHMEWGIVKGSGSGARIWNNLSEEWNDETSVWGDRSFDSTRLNLLASDYSSGTFVEMENGYSRFGIGYRSYIQRVGMPILDEMEQENGELNPTRNKFLRRVYPKIQSSKPVRLRVGVQRTYGEAIDWEPWRDFDPTSELHLDYRMNGKYLAVEIDSQELVGFQVYGFYVEYIPLGEGVR